MITRVSPKRGVRRATHVQAFNVGAVWKIGREKFYEPRAKVFVEKQLHPAV